MKNSLNSILKKKELTQTDLANYLKIAPSLVSRYCSGKIQMTSSMLCEIADYLHVSVDEILGRKTNNINLESLEPKTKAVIEKILHMNNVQLEKVIITLLNDINS